MNAVLLVLSWACTHAAVAAEDSAALAAREGVTGIVALSIGREAGHDA